MELPDPSAMEEARHPQSQQDNLSQDVCLEEEPAVKSMARSQYAFLTPIISGTDVCGSTFRAYGSGYPGVAGRGVAGRNFPFVFWPIAWAGAGVGGGAYLHNSQVCLILHIRHCIQLIVLHSMADMITAADLEVYRSLQPSHHHRSKVPPSVCWPTMRPLSNSFKILSPHVQAI